MAIIWRLNRRKIEAHRPWQTAIAVCQIALEKLIMSATFAK
ncbi:MAG TPA: hypothetical protein PLO51_00780 [Candidatus Micrarchaeota archaeon]|nr:hypothetical protein [Candidatus Micrarchaeota archaeon]